MEEKILPAYIKSLGEKYPKMKEKEYSEIVEGLYRVGSGELLAKRATRLKKRGLISEDLELEDILKGRLKESEKEIIAKECAEILEKRLALGYDTIVGYHTSTEKYEAGDKIPIGEDGKAYFSDIDALYAARGRKTMRYVYRVSAEGRHKDVREGWYYSLTPLTVTQKWTVEDFMKEHGEASFR